MKDNTFLAYTNWCLYDRFHVRIYLFIMICINRELMNATLSDLGASYCQRNLSWSLFHNSQLMATVKINTLVNLESIVKYGA